MILLQHDGHGRHPASAYYDRIPLVQLKVCAQIADIMTDREWFVEQSAFQSIAGILSIG